MSGSRQDTDKNIASLVDVTEALLRGEFDREAVSVDTGGMLSVLAQKINTMVVNLRTVELPLVSAEGQAPSVVNYAANVVELMAQSTDVVLAKSDKATELLEKLEKNLADSGEGSIAAAALKDTIIPLKAALFDIIASQSYQDVARQKMEKLINDLNQIRDWLIEALIVLNLSKSTSAEYVQEKTEILREMSSTSAPDALKQNLVDELLAEFGF